MNTWVLVMVLVTPGALTPTGVDTESTARMRGYRSEEACKNAAATFSNDKRFVQKVTSYQCVPEEAK